MAESMSRNLELVVGEAEELPCFDHTFDIVFTNAVLTHIGNDKIKCAIQELLRVAKKRVVLLEPHTFGLSKRKLFKMGILPYRNGQWIRDYAKLIPSNFDVSITKVPDGLFHTKPWKELGAIIEINKEDE